MFLPASRTEAGVLSLRSIGDSLPAFNRPQCLSLRIKTKDHVYGRLGLKDHICCVLRCLEFRFHPTASRSPRTPVTSWTKRRRLMTSCGAESWALRSFKLQSTLRIVGPYSGRHVGTILWPPEILTLLIVRPSPNHTP